jgi:hypothetical protein
LSNVSVDDSGSYGIFCDDSTVSLAGCTVQGRYGIYASSTNDALTINSTRIENTYLVYLRFQMMRGVLDQANYDSECDRVRECLNRMPGAHWKAFLDGWPR